MHPVAADLRQGDDGALKSALPPGSGASFQVVFRDPPPPAIEAAALRLEIARILVGASALPAPLPAFGQGLLDIEVEGDAIVLVLGREAVLARLAISPAGGAATASSRAETDLISLGTPSLKNNSIPRAGELAFAAHVRITVTPIAPDWKRFERLLVLVAQRLRAAIGRNKWDAAWAVARRLARLPLGVPLGFFRQIVAGIAEPLGLVRTGFNCNQDCGLCWQGRDWGRFGPEQVLTWIEDLAAGGARSLIISGGEPTLDPALIRYLGRARDLKLNPIVLETNAIQCAKPGVAERLRDAGLTEAFVSLHSPDEAVSDAITRAPGTFARTLRGIDALLAAGLAVRLNCVMTRDGLATLDALPDFIHSRFGGHPALQGLMLSSPTDSFDPGLLPLIIPDPALLRPQLRRAIDRALALGISVTGLDGPCGPPLCAFGADPRIVKLTPVSEPVEFRRFLPACDGCAVRHACFGVRTAQLALYGGSCIEPIAPTAR